MSIMPRLLLAGGLDYERAAFAAELADEWNTVPHQCEPYHEPMRLLEPEQVHHLAELASGNWVLHGNHYTRHQARAVGYATQVIVIGFDESQVDGSKEYRAMLKSRHRIRALAYASNTAVHMMSDVSFYMPGATTERAVNVQAQMGSFLLGYKMHDCREHRRDLQIRRWEAQKVKDHLEWPFV